MISVASGTRTLKDATNEAIRDWVTNVDDTFYIIGSVVGPHPYPMMVRDFQSIIGTEVREQMLAREGRPVYVRDGADIVLVTDPNETRVSHVQRSGDTLITGKVRASFVDASDLQANAFRVVTGMTARF